VPVSSIFTTLRLWVAQRGDRVYLLAPGYNGLPEPVVESLPVLRARYLSPGGIEAELERGRDFLDPPAGSLIVRTGDSEAPPASTALLFAYQTTEPIDCKIGAYSKHVEAHLYLAATNTGSLWAWHSDLVQGKYGYFLVGGPGRANLWKIRRAEADFASRLVFTIAPVGPSNGLPVLDLGSVQNEEMRRQIDQHWREFVEVFTRQLPFRTVNAAKDVCEYLMYDMLQRDGTIAGGKHELGDLLKRLSEVLQARKNASVPFGWIHFHLMQKIRLLHGRIHAGRVVADGPITPELALSVSTDLVEVLTAAGLVTK
jgi:hypothetical protein